MGSLMSGWDLPVSNSKSVEYTRNRSFTKEEIEAFWKSKKKIEEEHLRAISAPENGTTEEDTIQEHGVVKFQRSSSLPPADKKLSSMNMETETSLEDLIKKNGWWRRSNWAFLNEPPVIESSANTYSAQFHIANMAKPKPDSGISAI